MEYFSLRTLLNWFQSIGLDVRMLVTDRYHGPNNEFLKHVQNIRSTTVRKIMAEEYPKYSALI